MKKVYRLKSKLQAWNGSIGFWHDIEQAISNLKQVGIEISAELFDDRIEIVGDEDGIDDINQLINCSSDGLESDFDVYLKEG